MTKFEGVDAPRVGGYPVPPYNPQNYPPRYIVPDELQHEINVIGCWIVMVVVPLICALYLYGLSLMAAN
jgi:hypothetical protein